MIAYFDTSAAVKLVVAEAGTDAASRLFDAARAVASSVLMYPEARAALKRARRERRLSMPQLRAAVSDFERLWQGFETVGVATPLARRAGALAHAYDLRGYDAVHLASAELLRSPELVFVGADLGLCVAAHRLGFAVANVAR